jgi:hypothetical protein
MLRALAVLACAAALGSVGASAARRPALEVPRAAELYRAGAAIADSMLSSPRAQRLLAARAYWGGRYTASSGDSVTIYVSDAYAQDPATPQRWAEFLTSLVHGPELAKLKAYLAPLSEVQSICGAQALACYEAGRSLLVAPGEDPTADTSAEAVITHEYGHHVAANRSDAPWSALARGTKRWSSYENVCARTRRGAAFPGAEDFAHYRLNPGEAFAEAYRVLNERKLGVPEAPWSIVSTSFYPDASALAVLSADVTSPWRQAPPTVLTGTLRAGVRSYRISTPYDGTFRATLRAPAGARFDLSVRSVSGATLGATSTAPSSRARTLTTIVCGARTLVVRVARESGGGAYRLAVSTP